MNIDPTISLGSIMQVISLLGGVLYVAHKLGKLETKVETMWQVFIETVKQK